VLLSVRFLVMLFEIDSEKLVNGLKIILRFRSNNEDDCKSLEFGFSLV